MKISSTIADRIADSIGAEVYEDYSGRGMFGSQCVGFIVEDRRAEARLNIALARYLDEDEADNMLDRLSTDSLGLRTIVYFPGVTLDDE